MKLTFTFGPQILTNYSQFSRVLLSQDYVCFFGLICLMVAILNPLEATKYQAIHLQLLIWLAAASIFHFGLLCTVWAAQRAPFLAYSPIGYVFALIASETFNYYVHFQVLDAPLDTYPGAVLRILHQLSIILVAEQIFVRFVICRLLKAARSDQMNRSGTVGIVAATETEPPPLCWVEQKVPGASDASKIGIGEAVFAATDIRLLIAQEHYVQVVSDQGTVLLKDKISRAAGQLPPRLGMRVHRSYWIAYAHTHKVVKEAPGRFAIVTHDEQRIPLSRKLRKEFAKRLSSNNAGAGQMKQIDGERLLDSAIPTDN